MAVLFATSIFAADLALSVHAPDPTAPEDYGVRGLEFGGAPIARDPPVVPRSQQFPRLGSIALNLTPCLHDTGDRVINGFTCESDLYSSFADSHENGDHFGNLYEDFREYYRSGRTAEEGDALARQLLMARGIDDALMEAVCANKRTKPTEDSSDAAIPWRNATPPEMAPTKAMVQQMLSSICIYLPFFESSPWFDDALHDVVDWGQMDGPLGPMAGGGDHHGGEGDHGHSGPHGLTFNTEMNWLYAAMSHQGKVAIVNLNVIDWGKVAAYEEETGMRVLLFEDQSVFNARAVHHYASQIVKHASTRDQALRELDAVHRYCFEENRIHLDRYVPRWEDSLPTPENAIEDALAHISAQTIAPSSVPPPANTEGFACFLAFAGIHAVHYLDAEFANTRCTFDTRHLARYDEEFSPGVYSKPNQGPSVGAGDAWRCGWLVRYVEITKELEIPVRRLVPLGAQHNFPGEIDVPVVDTPGAATAHVPDTEWVETKVIVKIGPHDLGYSAGDGNLYVTHYWTMDDPDIRMLPDWTIHVLPQNPMLDDFVNPWRTRNGPPEWAHAGGSAAGTDQVDGRGIAIDLGGPIDALHPVTLDVEDGRASIVVANREANTLSGLPPAPHRVLDHGGHGVDFARRPDERLSAVIQRSYDVYREDAHSAVPVEPAEPFTRHMRGPLPEDQCAAHAPLDPADTAIRSDELCEAGLLRHTGVLLPGERRDALRQEASEGLAAMVAARTPWPRLVSELHRLLSTPEGSSAVALDVFRARFYPLLTSDEDVPFLEAQIETVLSAEPGADRTLALAEARARLEGRLPGLGPVFVEELLDALDIPYPVERTMGTKDLVERWADRAASGELLGVYDAMVVNWELSRFVKAITQSSLQKHPGWLQYCVGYSLAEILITEANGEAELHSGKYTYAPSGARVDEAREFDGRHCDDVDPPYEVWATPLQTDTSISGADVIREPSGAMFLDWWYELRPRFFQPFDVWVNGGNGHIYVGNLGNHDNAPDQRGWVTQVGEPRDLPCIYNELEPYAGYRPDVQVATIEYNMGDGKKGPGEEIFCRLGAPNKFGIELDSDLAAERLMGTGALPHHLNVNPYTEEVYIGHLEGGGKALRVAQFDERHSFWTLPKQEITAGPEDPVGSPTGMVVNPASRRLFFTRFLMGEHHEHDAAGIPPPDPSRHVGMVDLRSYTATALQLFGGDHHAAFDATQPPGGTTEDPFYNRTREIAVGDRRILGSFFATADTSLTLSFFWRCTYYAADLDVSTKRIVEDTRLDAGAILREPYRLAGANAFHFDAGRCFNLMDLNHEEVFPFAENTGGALGLTGRSFTVNPRRGIEAFEGPYDPVLKTKTWYETGAEYLTYGVLHLYMDPDDVPPDLEVPPPQFGSSGREGSFALQATEELASAYLEVEEGAPVPVPRGEVVLAPAGPLAPGQRWWLDFVSAHQVEPRAPDPDVDLAVRVGPPAAPVEIAWRPVFSAGPAWLEWPVVLPETTGGPLRIEIALTQSGLPPVPGRSVTVGGLRLETPTAIPGVFDVTVLPLSEIEGDGAFALKKIEDPSRKSKEIHDAVWFVDSREVVGDGRFWIDLPAAPPADTRLVVLFQVNFLSLPPVDNKPYDVMTIDATLDAGLTWRNVWRRDNRDPHSADPAPHAVDVTRLVATAETFRVRVRFDAGDPAYNRYPGWTVGELRLRPGSGDAVDLQVVGELPGSAGPAPAWIDVRTPGAARPTLRFTNDAGNYDTTGTSIVCRMRSEGHGAWSVAGVPLPPGRHRLSFCGRDLAGNEVRRLVEDGEGVALVYDEFENVGFTESYWRREEIDPHGIAFAGYVDDKEHEKPYSSGTSAILAPRAPAAGENHLARRAILGDTGNRAFVTTPGEPDVERLARGLQEVVAHEAAFLNLSHVGLLQPPEEPPVLPPYKTLGGECPEMYGCDQYIGRGIIPMPSGQGFEPGFLELLLDTGSRVGMLDPPRPIGVRTHQNLATYLADAIPAIRPEASERLVHPFPFDPTTATPTGLELSFDVSARHRAQAYDVDVAPVLPLPDLFDLSRFLAEVTLDKMAMTEAEFAKLVGSERAAKAAFGEPAWMASTTFATLGLTPEEVWAGLTDPLEEELQLLSETIQVSTLLDAMGLHPMSLPTYGAGFGIRVSIVAPDGTSHLLVERDGIEGGPIDLQPVAPGGDVRVTLVPGPDPGTYAARVRDELEREERLRVRLDANQAAAIFAQPGEYQLVVESRIVSPVAPAPGLEQALVYGALALRVPTAPVANTPPDASFAWWGPVAPGQRVPFLPGRVTPVLANVEDLDGRIARYEWTFHGVGAADVELDGRALVADADPGTLDDLRTNADAIGYGLRARALTVVTEGGATRVSYETSGCHLPIPSVAYPAGGEYAVELKTVDDVGGESIRTHTVRVASGPPEVRRRAPEMIVDPVDVVDGDVRVYWQQNPGSLFLSAAGKGLNLTELIPSFDPSTLDELDKETLLARIDFSQSGDVTQAEVAGAVATPEELAAALESGAFGALALLSDWLLLRPGVVQVVTADAEDASTGVRFATKIDGLPGRASKLDLSDVRLPVELDLADPLPGLECLPISLDGESFAPCEGALADPWRLARSALLPMWAFRYALHPHANGEADLDTTLVQVLVWDAGFGPRFQALSDLVDIEPVGLGGPLLDSAEVDGLDPVFPVSEYEAIARKLVAAAQAIAASSVNLTVLAATAEAPGLGEPGSQARKAAVEIAATTLHLDAQSLAAKRGEAAALRGDLARARAKAITGLADARAAEAQVFAQADATLAFWSPSLAAGVVAAPARQRLLDLHADADAGYLHAQTSATGSSEAVEAALDAIEEAYDVAIAWADNWTGALAAGDPEALHARLDAAAQAGLDTAVDVVESTDDVRKEIHDTVEALLDFLFAKHAPAVYPRDSALVLGYDPQARRAFVRVGDGIVFDGALEGVPPTQVHASISFLSLLPEEMSVEALWSGWGADLVDGFNRNGPLDARFDVLTPGGPGTTAQAVPRIVTGTSSDTTHQVAWVSRSPEERPPEPAPPASSAIKRGWGPGERLEGSSLADGARAPERLNAHRYLHDGRASPPWTYAAHHADTVVTTADARAPPLPLPAGVVSRADDVAGVYSATVERLAPGAWQEIRVADSHVQPRSVPAKHLVPGPPPAPYVFDVAAFHAPGGTETLKVSFQPAGAARPAIERYEVFSSPRPRDDASAEGRIPLGTVAASAVLTDPFGHYALTVPAAPAALDQEWRYVAVRAVNVDGAAGRFSPTYLVPPTRLEERFATRAEGPAILEGARTIREDGRVDVELGGLPLTLDGDSCLGDRVAITRETSYPHDQIAAPWARALVVRERGLDTLFEILRLLSAPLASVPVDLRMLDAPVPDEIGLCPSLEGLIRAIRDIDDPDLKARLDALGIATVAEALGAQPALAQPPIDPETDPVLVALREGRFQEAWAALARRLAGDTTIDLELGDLVNGRPATIEWETEPIEGPWAARARFQIPSRLRVPGLESPLSLDGLVSDLSLLGLGVLLPLERPHVLQVGHTDSFGRFAPIAEVELAAQPLAEVLAHAAGASGPAAYHEIAHRGFTSLIAGELQASDTATNHEPVGIVTFDRWHTVELYGTGDSGIYSVAIDGHWIAELRTASPLPPNAIRLGGSPQPSTLIFDDVRLMPALHPAAPWIAVAPEREALGYNLVTWHAPESGGAPIVDYTLLRRDIVPAGGTTQVVATAGGGHVRALVDPTSHDARPGVRAAYSVQAVNALRAAGETDVRNVGPASDARTTGSPAYLHVRADTSVSHAIGLDLLDGETYGGTRGISVGVAGLVDWLSMLSIEASGLADAVGRRLLPTDLAHARLLVHSMSITGLDAYSTDTLGAPYPPDAARVGDVEGKLGVSESWFGDADCRFPLINQFDASGALLVGAVCEHARAIPGPHCPDGRADSDATQIVNACHEDAIAAHILPEAGFDPATATWRGIPRDDFDLRMDGLEPQRTNAVNWRHYDILAALRRDADGDVGVVLRKHVPRADSTLVTYAATEAGTWLDERAGVPATGPRAASPWIAGASVADLPWTRARASSGAYSLHLDGPAGIAAVAIPIPQVTVPARIPIQFDVLVPAGSAPREIGLRMEVDSVDNMACELAATRQDLLAVWGNERLAFDLDRRLTLDEDGEVGPYGDLATRIEREATFHAGGVPPQRDRWVRLSVDLHQALLEVAPPRQKLREDEMQMSPGPLFAVPHPDDGSKTRHWRLQPFHTRGLGTDCMVEILSLEIFVVDGEIYVDRVGPDIGPRVRLGVGSVVP